MESLKTETLGKVRLYNGDCMDFMKQVPDKFYDLAIVDPPYGIGVTKRDSKARGGQYLGSTHWDDSIPNQEYFDELFRVSKNQIIWGGNYFDLPPTRGFIFWFKHQTVPNYSDGEFAWTSFDRVAKCFDYPYYGSINKEHQRLHLTQKPVKLYEWLLANYAKEGDKILDTHFGSLSIGLACHNAGFELDACELDPVYYAKAKQRLIDHQKQLKLNL